jgi:hypothetical protein
VSRAKRRVRGLFAAWIALYAIAVTYPGITPFNRIQPLIFGLPFVFFWIVLWIVIGLIVLVITDIVESR